MNPGMEIVLQFLLKYLQNRRQILMTEHLRQHSEFLEIRKIAYQRRKNKKHFLATQFSIPRWFFTVLIPRKRRFSKLKRNQNQWTTLQDPKNSDTFYETFRMSRDALDLLCKKLEPFLPYDYNCRPPPLSIEKQVAVSVYKLSTAAEYRVVGDVFGIHKTTVHKYFHRVIDAILELKNEYIKFPNLKEALVIAEQFEKISLIPNIIGVIDDTRMSMLPSNAANLNYGNENVLPSLVMQAVVDNNYKFRDVYVTYAESTQDTEVFKQSELYNNSSTLIPEHFKTIGNLEMPLQIVGGPSYPLLPWLMKPYDGAVNKEQESFNSHLSSAKIVAENAFARLKGRWRALRKRIDVAPEFLLKIVLACAILHNFVEENKQQYLHVWSNHSGAQSTCDQSVSALQTFSEINRNPEDMRNNLKNYLKNVYPPRST